MLTVHILRDGRAFDDGQHAIAQPINQHKQAHHHHLPCARHGCQQQRQHTQRDQQRHQAVDHMQVGMLLKKVQQQTPCHLHHANGSRQGNHPELGQAVFTQQAHHVRWNGHCHRHHQHGKNTNQQKWRAAQQGLHARHTGCLLARSWPHACRRTQQGEPMQRRTDQQVQQGQHKQSRAPAKGAHQPGVERNKHRAGQATQKSQRDDGAAKVVRKASRQQGKSRRIQHRRHGRSQTEPDRIQTGQAGDHAVQQQARPGQHRACRHHRTLVAAVNPAPHRVGHQALGQQSQTERQRHLCAVQTQVTLQRLDQQRKQVKNTAPTDELCQ